MMKEIDIKGILELQKIMLNSHYKECQVCPVVQHECKTHLILSDRIDLLQKIINNV